ncbi:uncharacterized protein FOMMEDRAFT_109078 [Fomitiporia mediterranea MF3/22]|uniref:uncharacterized protein n=1 Tax=Fomitiporia mediterranea (strain MF3/22) TaxID=694068 RepID=UPI0004409907|nr:uncharacterized protein FOMMEDRAFT_109078 [Fomitiporia mediterranea MF3/22]EJD01998.1 hypothetical protein FOMMEDRAFT_109078 [Fomitiporia mediterranea MF3/22]
MAVSRESLWNSGHDESVEVNQRALIDKVLARYSGEFTVFRELLQNSDDASSKSVEIHFETQAHLDRRKTASEVASIELPLVVDKFPDLRTEPVSQWTFKNNGIIFREEDWNRLKKIAEGNPDEEKIGAFGVGFYSLFSVTEEPFVTSGDKWMGFYWKDKKDQLFARRGTLPQPSQWTTFEMALREPAPMPVAFDLSRFLVSSITFMVHLREVCIYFDGRMLSRLVKDPGGATAVSIPQGLKTKSPLSTMHIRAISSTPLFIEAEVARSVYKSGTTKMQIITQAARALKPAAAAVSSGFFSSLSSLFSSPSQSSTPQRTETQTAPLSLEREKDPLELLKSSVVLHIFSAEVDVRLDRKMSTELQRSTKKSPPNHLRYDLIYTGKSEYDASMKEDEKFQDSTGSIFQGLRADLEGSGSARIFIGHATGQTTGLGGHMAARFIPTVERESIDLVDRTVSQWNKELLYVGGFLARAVYETEIMSIRELWTASAEGGSGGIDEQIQSWLTDRCLHALKFFTFHPSTPSNVVSNLLEAAFFSSGTSQPFSIMSSIGVKSAADVRIPDSTFSSFLTQLPVLPKEIATGAELLVNALRIRGLIKDISFADVLGELRARPLSQTELVACMNWFVRVWAAGESVHPNLPQVRQQLIEAALLSIGTGTAKERIVPLEQIRSFVNLRSMGSVLPLDGPIPEHTIPIEVSKNFQVSDLISTFGWQELTIVDWTRFVVSPAASAGGPEHDITISAIWAERVLNTLARAWPSMSKSHQAEIVNLLKDKTCIPTRSGLKQPGEAYFPNAHVFPDLPVVTMPKGSQVKGNLEKVLEALGVRKHVELQVVFDRMIKTGDWTIADLIKYLVAVQQTLSSVEMDRLRQTSCFAKETVGDEAETGQVTKPRFKAGDLYEPLDVFRQLKLPIIDWGAQTKWKPHSEEAKFLFALNLRRFPPLSEILTIASDQDEVRRSAGLRYFLDNIAKYPDYDPTAANSPPFVPAVKPDGNPTMGTPDQVFMNSDAAVFGFLVAHSDVRDDAQARLKLKQHPPLSAILPILEKSPPKDPSLARKWFETLAGRITELSPAQLKKLTQMQIVPVAQPLSAAKDVEKVQARLLAPKDCYFKREGSENLHSKLFVFVDFGTKANAFLSACGTKHEPSVEEIVQILLEDPKRFYRLAGGKDSYLMELRNIAINRRLISPGIVSRMKKSAILLGIRRVKKEKSGSKKEAIDDALDEEEWDSQYDLLKPDQVVVADDTNAFQFFGDSVFSAPQEDILENFYSELGSPRLTTLVREDYKTSAEIKDAKLARDVRALILERLPLFLHEHTHVRSKVQYSWLNNERNFVVRTFGKLTVTKHLNFEATRISRNQDASATAKKATFGPVELWLAGNAQVDMYEVAISLCRVLFDVPKVNDALLFMTILSTDLRALRRRGYNVDRILKKQRAEREAAEQARREQAREMEKLVSDISPNMPQHPPPTIASSSTEPISQPPQPASTDGPPSPPSKDLEERSHRPTSSIANQFANWRRKLGVANRGDTSNTIAEDGHSSTSPSRPTSSQGRSRSPPIPGGFPGVDSAPHQPQSNVTPLSSIESNIKQAITACREERGNVLQNRETMQTVHETLDEGYCDISGRVSDLVNIGSMSDIKVFVAKDVPEGRNIIAAKHDSIARFIHVIRPLRTLYKLPPTSVNIFYDMEGDSIAFNRNASLFVNLRYYEAWHDHDVHNGNLSKAFISWFFTLAHEIAHNLVQPHNSEHEFYFSSICEAHVTQLSGLISGTSST